jgi:hypothetical protein
MPLMLEVARMRTTFEFMTIAALACVAADAPQPPRQSQAGALSLLTARAIALPCGIADPAGRTGFFASATEGIAAVDLKSGEVLWESAEAQRPLMIDGTRLIAQAGVKRNRLRILVYDLTQNGLCVLESDPVVLPAWVVVADAPGRSFEARWRLDRNQVVLNWEATAWYSGPNRPSGKEQTAACKHGAGTARIDLDSGRVEQGPAETAAASGPPEVSPELEKKAIRWQGQVGNLRAAILLDESSGHQALVLHTWDRATGREGQPKELARGNRLLVQPTLDGHFLCLRDAGSAPDEKNLGRDRNDQYWSLVSLDLAGVVLAKFPYEPGMQSITVLGTRAYYCVSGNVRGRIDRPMVQSRVLKSYDLAGGKALWSRPVAGKVVAPPVR